MKIMIVGSGGREAALAWAVRRSPRVTDVVAAPGNPGLAETVRCLPVAADDVEGLVRAAVAENPDLVMVGPEAPLTLGLADRLEAENLAVFGPAAAAARLEGSKAFAKTFMEKQGIPTARYRICEEPAEAAAAVEAFGTPVVVKADGLAAGKGVTVARSREEALAAVKAVMSDRVFGNAGERIVVEECLRGEEASLLAFADGTRVAAMLPAQDHKRIFEQDEGPNTGGMGAYAPAPVVTPDLRERIQREILEPVVRGMAADGTPYRGVLYAGLMITEDGPKVIEFNCRFGDPEIQAILPLLDADVVEIALDCTQGVLEPAKLAWRNQAAVCVVMAAHGYPGRIRRGDPIEGLEAARAVPDVLVWEAGTARQHGRPVTAGGRVLNVVGRGGDLAAAVRRAYQAVECIRFEGAQVRRDIAARAMARISSI